MVRETVLREIAINEVEFEEEFDDEISVNEVAEFDGSDAFSEFSDFDEIVINEDDEIELNGDGEQTDKTRQDRKIQDTKSCRTDGQLDR
ncbi:MAG: hypothetical protein EZS28_035095 [Streblomastix strix]|uniref:Uncharacterized protein n=1 Tax=Streblomastix strix TaxID=222440 RepID=A0A5J4UFJ2_9EUKA|nr:MAG: hypothetical protein EZS28_035095 [Streblomastix strix]